MGRNNLFTMLVSVILPTYNRFELLKMAINSFLNQSYDNAELIIFDNGSTDGTNEWLNKNYVRGNVKIIRSYFNKPVPLNNIWKNYCNGELICQLHDDDELTYHSLKDRVRIFMNHSETEVVYGGVIEQNIRGEWLRDITAQPIDKDRILTDEYINFTTIMWRKSVMEKFMFDSDLEYYADWFFKIRCLQECKVAYTPSAVMKYTIHSGQESVRLRGSGAKEEKIMREKIKKLYGV